MKKITFPVIAKKDVKFFNDAQRDFCKVGWLIGVDNEKNVVVFANVRVKRAAGIFWNCVHSNQLAVYKVTE